MLRGLNVDTHFLNPCPKSHIEESPMKSKAQRPTKKTEEQERFKERSARKMICSKIQICCRIQFFGKMASADKDKLGLRPF